MGKKSKLIETLLGAAKPHHVVEPGDVGRASKAAERVEPTLDAAATAGTGAAKPKMTAEETKAFLDAQAAKKSQGQTGTARETPKPDGHTIDAPELKVKPTHDARAKADAPAAVPSVQSDINIPGHLKKRAERTQYLKEHGITPPQAPAIGVNGRANMLDSWLYNRRVKAFDKQHFGDLQPPRTTAQVAARTGLGAVFAVAAASPFADGAGMVEPGKMNPITLLEHTIFNLPDLVTGRDSTSPISSIVVNTGKMTNTDYLKKASDNPLSHPDIQLEVASARTKGAADVTAQGAQAAAGRDASIQRSMAAGVDATADRLNNPRPLPSPEPTRN
jgi:hypothetical protein